MNKKIVIIPILTFLALSGSGALIASNLQTTTGVQEDDTAPLADSLSVKGIGTKFVSGESLPQITITTLKSDLGVQVSEGTIAGCKNLRFVAALTNSANIISASWSRTMVAPDSSIVKSEASFLVDTVYSDVEGLSSVNFETALTSEYGKYMVYTMTNIPESHYFDALNVTLSVSRVGATTTYASAKANVYGALGDTSLGVVYAQNSAETSEGTWHAQYSNKAITEAVVSRYKLSFDGFVATNLGEVVAIGDSTSYTGGFEGCSYLTSVTLPDSINLFNKYCFSGCKLLKELSLPTSLTQTLSSCWNNVTLDVLNFKATSLTGSVVTAFPIAIKRVNISSNVVALPKTFMASGKTITEIHYDGTTANYALISSGADVAFTNTDVFCTDTVVNAVTFALEGGTLEDSTSDLVVPVISGKVVANPGSPILEGKFFYGWVLDLTSDVKYDFTSIVSSDFVIHAKFIDNPAGISLDSPAIITETFAASVTTGIGMETYYMSFTAPAKDAYIFSVDGMVIDSSISTYTTADPIIKVYDSLKNEVTYASYSPKTDAKVSGTDKQRVRLMLEEGETYYLSVVGYYNSYYSTRHVYGDITCHIETHENDSIDTALPIEGETVIPASFVSKADTLFFAYHNVEAKDYVLKEIVTGSLWGSYTLFDAADMSTEICSVKGTSTTGVIVSLKANTDYIICATTNNMPSETATQSFMITAASSGQSVALAEDLTSEGSGEFTASANYLGYRWYKYVSTTAGIKIVNTTALSVKGTRTIAIYKADGTTAINSASTTEATANDLLSFTSEANAEYLVKVSFSSATSMCDFSFSIIEAPVGYDFSNPLGLSLGDNTVDCAYGTISSGAITKGTHCSFTSTNDGYIHLTSVSTTTTISLFSSAAVSSSTLIYSAKGEAFAKVTAGTTIYIFLNTSVAAGESITLSLSVKDTLVNGLSADTAFNIPSSSAPYELGTGTLTSNNYLYFSFTCETTGSYIAYSNCSEATGDTYGYLYEASNLLTALGSADKASAQSGLTNPANSEDFDFAVNLTAGTTYVLKVRFYASALINSATKMSFLIGITLAA